MTEKKLSRVSTILEKLDRESLYEMATLSPDEHKLGVDVKMNIPQPGRPTIGGHGPRAKFFKPGTNPKTDPNFSIAFGKTEESVWVVNKVKNEKDIKKVVTPEELKLLIEAVLRYREDFMKFWMDSTISPSELRKLMNETDKRLAKAKQKS